ncbi:MAG: undecaprenyl/decaprenyl-phosphate alpha-N-acetylglucosaminyl 1-phosphate transferase [Candidatus Omnitrophica bacterium]|nr:undecaprenyl/decaprenyl-phosphate alpha-N-acetylglucosaminyl 1-phosphate transferase [Candidatus Omnitrophota bacterium]
MLINIFLANFLFSIISVLILRKLLLRFRLKGVYIEKVDRKITKIGGMVILLSLLVSSLILGKRFFLFKSLYFTLFITAFLVFLLGMIDDLKELKAWQKFLGEMVIVLFFLFISNLTTEVIYLPRFVNFFITLFWILGITNAFNLLDIQDGLSTGVSFLISLAFLYLAYPTGNKIVVEISLLLSSSLLAILIFNFPPAKIYLGDSGSLSLGYIFSILAILISYAKASHEIALLSPIFILGFPIFDTVFVSLRRLSKGKSIFKRSDDHFIICLLKKRNQLRCLLICYFLTLAFIILGILFTKLTNFASFILILLFLTFLIPYSLKLSRN